MKLNLNFKTNIKKLFVLGFVSVLFIFQVNLKMVKAIDIDNSQNPIVTEELRLTVPKEFRSAWLQAEKMFGSHGYLLRMVFWGGNYFGIKKKKKL